MARKQYIVIGLGRFGCSVCKTLFEEDADVLAVDLREERAASARDFSTHAMCADATDPDVLKQLGISDFDVGIVTIGGDIKASGVITMLLKEMGVSTVIAKAHDETHGRMLIKLGADKVVFPERDMGRRVAHNLASTHILDFIEISPDFSLVEISPPAKWAGRNLRQLDLRARWDMNIIAIKTGEKVNASPGPDTVIDIDDVLLVMSSEETLKKLRDK